MRPSDTDILSMTKVTPAVAGQYLGISDDSIRDGLINGNFPFGTAIRSESGRYVYDIRPIALVNYNRNGRGIDIEALADRIIQGIKKEA